MIGIPFHPRFYESLAGWVLRKDYPSVFRKGSAAAEPLRKNDPLETVLAYGASGESFFSQMPLSVCRVKFHRLARHTQEAPTVLVAGALMGGASCALLLYCLGFVFLSLSQSVVTGLFGGAGLAVMGVIGGSVLGYRVALTRMLKPIWFVYAGTYEPIRAGSRRLRSQEHPEEFGTITDAQVLYKTRGMDAQRAQMRSGKTNWQVAVQLGTLACLIGGLAFAVFLFVMATQEPRSADPPQEVHHEQPRQQHI